MFWRRIRYWWMRFEREDSLRAEMEAHLEEKAAELRDGGLSESDARLEARRLFGNLTRKQEEARDIWITRYWQDYWQDTSYAIRNLRRQPSFAAVAILSAALGIGACSTVFGIVNFALLRPLPVREPDRLLMLTGIHLQDGKAGSSLSYPEIADIRAASKSLAGISPIAPFLAVGISSGGEPKRYWGFLVAANYFDVVQPGFAAGRGFTDLEDDKPGAPAKIVLSSRCGRAASAVIPEL